MTAPKESSVAATDAWIVEFDSRSDGGPRRVGTWNTEAGAHFWLSKRTFDYDGASVVPVAWHDEWPPVDTLFVRPKADPVPPGYWHAAEDCPEPGWCSGKPHSKHRDRSC